MVCTLAGGVVGIAAAAALSGVLRTLLFEVSGTDPISFGAVTVVMMVVTIAACWFPARAATRVEPAVALRRE